MTLFQIIQILKQIALTQPNIKSATDGSIYEVMNTNPSIKYNVVHFSQTTHQSDEETDYYGLNIFYVSRLEDSLEDNRLQIQSIGKDILDNIIRTFCENWNIDFPVITYTPFTQKFNDLCAGCYCNLKLEIPKEILCADDYLAEVVPNSGLKLQDIGITITENGLRVITADAEYDGIGEIRIKTEVPQVTSKDLVANIQGDYFLIPEGTTKIRNYAFQDACFSPITIPSSVTTIGDYAFAGNNCLEEIVIPSTVQTIGNYAFNKCQNLTSATFENSAITNIGTDIFRECMALREAKLPAALTTLPKGTFAVCESLTAVTIPSGVTSLGEFAFVRCQALTAITLPPGITSIDRFCFDSCSSLRTITIPDSVTSIGGGCFGGNSGMTSMVFEGTTPPQIDSVSIWSPSLGSTDYTFPIYVPCEAVDAYKAAFGEGYAPRIQCKEEQESTEDTANTTIP